MPFTAHKNDFLILDGGMGTQLQKKGLKAGELPELWNINQPDVIKGIHLDYLRSGADVVYINTFGLNRFKFKGQAHTVGELAAAAARNAREACLQHEKETGKKAFVALDIGPTGRLLKPVGDLDFEDCVSAYQELVIAAAPLCDLVVVETMTDPYEMKAAILAAKENCDLPVFATAAVDEQGKLLSGLDAKGLVALLEGLRVNALGLNCGADPRLLRPVIEDLVQAASFPLILKLNAGLPHQVDGKTVFDMGPKDFGQLMAGYAALGVQALGGCCGTTPEHIRELKTALKDIQYQQPVPKNDTLLCSYGRTVRAGLPLLIGERINPTGKKAMQAALRERDFNWMRRQAIIQEEQGADLLDINVGLPGVDEAGLMAEVVRAVQEVSQLPLQIDAGKPEVLESGLRAVNGKALINSVTGKEDSLSAVLPLVKKYGGVIAGLTLDESGIPQTAEGRLEIARKIVSRCEQEGIPKKDIVIDPLCMTVSADSKAAKVTLKALKLIKDTLQVKTMLGVSNISFGLPNRQAVNAGFVTLALNAGLDFAIINPGSELMMAAFDTYLLLSGQDEGARRYIKNQTGREAAMTASNVTNQAQKDDKAEDGLTHAIIRGLKEDAARLTRAALETKDAMEVINQILVPALTRVGDDFAKGTLFLPQLMMSADACAASFEVVREKLPKEADQNIKKDTIVIATVKGDIHDIGKNIVRALLENHGYHVLDLGKDVDHEKVVSACQREDCRLVGLSALMTTTVESMAETIRLLRENCPDTKIMVGGAVLTAEYAKSIGADFYGKTAMDSVDYAKAVFKNP